MSATVGFVGRQPELHILEQRLAAARTGQPQIVFIEGEAGAGKSTLLSHFLGSIPDAVIVEVGGDEAETLLSYGIVDQLHPGTFTEPGLDPIAAGSQLLAFFDQLQDADQVVVVSIEDLQWVDRPSSRALLFALRRLRADKVLTVVSSRTGELDDAAWARFVAGDSRVTKIRVGGLSSADLTQLASDLGLGALSDRAASELAVHTKGNALYCRALLDEIGVEGLSPAGNAGLPAPRGLSSVILTRVGALPASTQAFLAAAAVLGQHSPTSVVMALAELAGSPHEVDGAIATELVAESGSSEVTFAHPLYRAAIYNDLSPTRRRALHARAADLLAGRPRLVHRVAASLGPDEELARELETAGRAASDAGDAAASAWAMEQAAALSLAAADRERRLLDAAAVLLSSADTAAAARVLSSCTASSARCDALVGLLGVFTGSPTAEQRLLAAWETHDRVVETEIGARAATSLANLMAISGRPQQGLDWASRAVEATVAGSPLRAMACTAQAYALATAGRSTSGLMALGFLPASPNEVPLADTDALIMRGMLRVYTDDLSAAIADLAVAAARLRAGLPSTYPVPCLTYLSDAHFRRGDWDAALAHAEVAISLAQDADRPLDLARAHGQAAQVFAFRGQWPAARANVAAARAAAVRFPTVLAIAAAAVAAAALGCARGDWLAVLAATESVRATKLDDVGGRPGIFNWRAMEADALIGIDRLDDAQSALDAFSSSMPDGGLASAALSLARCQGSLAFARGDVAGTDAAFAAARLIGVSMPFEQALVKLDDGRRKRASVDRPAAVSLLEAAHGLFSELGADPYVQTCAAELAALSVPVVATAPATFGLSRAELAVARLAAAGKTNKEIAEELYLSVKTVEYHLRNIFQQLGIASRRELPASLR
ncbi:MAG TPA: LuxR C-terminal-related transcriptional regulator [Acidothermaceae bacterium]